MWIPLHVHSQYSVLDASASVKAIAKTASAMKMEAVALTDHGNMYGAVEFYKACKGAGVKPILGCELYVAPNSRHDKQKVYGERAAYHLTLLAKNDAGYHNLCKLCSIGFLEGFYYYPRVDHELLEKYSEGLICLSGCMSSRLSQAILGSNSDDVGALLDWYQKLYGDDFYLEVQRHAMSEEALHSEGINQEAGLAQAYKDFIGKQETLNEALFAIAVERKLPLVATNDSHYIQREDWQAHEILLNIQSGEPCEIWEKDSYGNPKFKVSNPKRRTYPSHELYFKSPEEMQALFHDKPEAIANTLEVAGKCTLQLDFETKHYPVYIPPALQGKSYTKEEQAIAAEKFLWELCEEGIPKRYTCERLDKVQELYPDKPPEQVIRERLEREMSVIAPKGMCDYLLIVWDFINWAKQNGIPVGPGRGSGAGSIVLYLIGITDIEPLRFHLFFERFINPERISYPDIDVDICMDRRGEVIQYTLEKYGKENVAQIITIGTMKAKMVIRDVGRVLSVPLAKVNAIAKMVPEDLNITLESALEKEPDLQKLYAEDEETRRLIDLGQKIEGSIRSTGIHAAGIIISGEPLTEYIPVCLAKDAEMPVSQYSMKPVEQVGMLKMDFLGLKTLTAIQYCASAIKASKGVDVDWVDLPLDDAATFQLLNQGKTLGVFQLESGGMQDLARNLHLDKFEEIIAVGALYRPGPMDMIPSFINRKHKREPIEYDHPWMEEILAETYGIMVYQEQVMQIASRLANYSLGEGDVLRRAMGKKEREQMAQQREKFRTGALENQISEEVSMKIFDKMEKFAEYGFNKSHAAAYGYIAYVTAYLKANYPSEWLAALMSCDANDLTKVAKYIREGKALKIPILPPDINESKMPFVATPSGIRFALSAIRGVGTGVVEAILEERERKGRFANLFDFFKRVDGKKVGKKTAELLVEAGCFDFTGWSRDALKQSVEPMFETALKEQKEQKAGVMTLFALMGETSAARFSEPPEVCAPSTQEQLLLRERELLGFFLTGHPMDRYRDLLARLGSIPLIRIDELGDSALFRSAVLIESVAVRLSAKSNRKFAIAMVSDGMVSYELPIWSDLYEEKHELLRENQLLLVLLQLEWSEGQQKLSCRWMGDLTKLNETAIGECNSAYEKVSAQIARIQRAKQSGKWNPKKEKKPDPIPQQPKKEEKPMGQEKLSIALDADNTRLSHILKCKELFRAHPGSTPIEVDFHTGDHLIGKLHIDAKWGIEISAELQKALKEISGVMQVSLIR